MGRVCMSCYESYGSEISMLKVHKDEGGIHFTCPKRGCRGEIVEIDDILVPTIILLNEKGYYTESCCSGHLEEMFTTTYIIFTEIVDHIPGLPPGFQLSAAIPEDGQRRFTLSKHIQGQSSVQVFQNILTTALQLYAWALSLPYADYEDDEEYIEDEGFFEKLFKQEEPNGIDPNKLKKDVNATVIPIKDFMDLMNNKNRKDK